MGGLGSGWARSRNATKTDELLRIDLADFKRWGVFEKMGRGSLTWSRGGVRHSEIGYTCTEDGLILDYRTPPRGTEEWRDVRELVPWAWSEQHIAGKRRWFRCLSCQQRARILYGSPFRCRSCHRAVYETQYERFRVPGITTAMRTREKLGGEAGLAAPFPAKPKGMHWRTYERLQEADWEAAMRLDQVFSGRLVPRRK